MSVQQLRNHRLLKDQDGLAVEPKKKTRADSTADNHPTLGWTEIADCFYRKETIYSLDWPYDFSQYKAAISSFGGPIALYKVFTADATSVYSNRKYSDIFLHTSSGRLISQIRWSKGAIVDLIWSADMLLVIVGEDGICNIYDINGSFNKSFSLGRELQVSKVIDCRGWGKGLVALTGDYNFYKISSFDDIMPVKMAKFEGLDSLPDSWEVLLESEMTSNNNNTNDDVFEQEKIEIGTELNNNNRGVGILVSHNESIYRINETHVKKMDIGKGVYTNISISPDGNMVALFDSKGTMVVTNREFENVLAETHTKVTEKPGCMCWCGMDSVVCNWDNRILMLGPFGTSITFTYNEAVAIKSEIDGLRVFCRSSHEFLQRVPDSIEMVYKFGSTEPSAVLYDAFKLYEQGNVRSDELIRSLKGESMTIAVNNLTNAALNEFNQNLQQKCLGAASFGKCFLNDYDSEIFTQACRDLRVLNAIRARDIAISTTYSQYKYLGIHQIIDRLNNFHHHLLAYRICIHKNINKSRVLVHWACSKVLRSVDDEKTRDEIINKLYYVPGISYVEIAKTAHSSGHPSLAIKLLEYETCAELQVPLLIKLNEDELALVKAKESGDTNLIYLALLNLKSKVSIGDFLHLIHDKRAVCDLFIKWCKENDWDLLKDFYYQDDRKLESTFLIIEEAYRSIDFANSTGNISEIQDSKLRQLRIASGGFSELKDDNASLYAKATDDEIKLEKFQAKCIDNNGLNSIRIGDSIWDTCFQLVVWQKYKMASDFKRDFKISDKKFWWIKLKALMQSKDWIELEKMASKKSPIGHEPFVELCIENNAKMEASKYIPKCLQERRTHYYLQTLQYENAIANEVELKSIEGLQMIQKSVKDSVVQAKVDRAIKQLS